MSLRTPPATAISKYGSQVKGATPSTLPRLCIVGPLVGGNPGHVTTIGDKWVPLLREKGYSVVAVSHSRNRYVRLADIVSTLLRVRRSIEVLWVIAYGGPSFVIEDAASWIGFASGTPIVISMHGGAMPEFMARFPDWTKRVLKRARCLVVPSEYLSRSLQAYGFRPRVIPNVIDIDAYPYRHRSSVRPRLFWMRTFHPFWNPEMAVRVLARVHERMPDSTLVMAGQDKGLQSQTKRLAAELGVEGAVRFPGFLDMDTKLAEADSADIFINTNRIDNQPVAIIEACSMGLPIVTTAVGGIPDLVTHEETALLVPDEDDKAMADAVIRLVENPDLASQLSTNGKALAERSAVSSVFPRWAEVFSALSERRAVKPW